MSENNNGILSKAEQYVQELLIEKLPEEFVFHNFDHAQEVASQCADLTEDSELSEEEREDLILAGWFHDVGFVGGKDGHEERSAQQARKFLEQQQHPNERIERVEQLIMSTHPDHEPKNELECLLYDARWSFVGRKRFARRGELLQIEKEKLAGEEKSLEQNDRELLELLLSTRFMTPEGRGEYATRKNKNIAKQREQIVKSEKKTTRRKTGKDFGRGVDTLYRTTLRNHIDLSSIADGKANMIISINTLVLSILITVSTTQLSFTDLSGSQNVYILAPVIVLMITALATIIFAVFSAMPKASGVSFTEEDVRQHKVSLLFFGNFLQIPKDRFVDHLNSLKENQELLYDDLSKDLYNLGFVLRKKYRLLNISYTIFVGGLVLSLITLFVSFWLQDGA